MRFQLASDLHLERHPNFELNAAPDVDLLVLAGDIGSYQAGSLLKDDDFGLGRFSPRNGEWAKVLFVPGNHEYDQRDFESTHLRLQQVCSELEIVFLERDSIVIDGVRFLGTTLWSDFDALASTLSSTADSRQVLMLRDKSFRAANYYLRKFGAQFKGETMLAESMRELALDCQAWLHSALASPFGGKTVVVTHFAPSLTSADPRYGVTPGTAGFCNSLDHLLPLADVWAHGHLHCPNSYQSGRCRVVSNPLGYSGKGEQESFIEHFVVDV
jgi:predicted phosphodiesterase